MTSPAARRRGVSKKHEKRKKRQDGRKKRTRKRPKTGRPPSHPWGAYAEEFIPWLLVGLRSVTFTSQSLQDWEASKPSPGRLRRRIHPLAPRGAAVNHFHVPKPTRLGGPHAIPGALTQKNASPGSSWGAGPTVILAGLRGGILRRDGRVFFVEETKYRNTCFLSFKELSLTYSNLGALRRSAAHT